MKNKLNVANYILATCLFCAFYIFTFDLICVGKISKFNHIWLDCCAFAVGDEYLNCMINYDVVSLLIVLPILSITSYCLFKHYHKYALFSPLLGFILFVISIITYWGLV